MTMHRFVLIFFVLWLVAAAIVFSHAGAALNGCLENHSASTCYAAMGG